MKEVMYGGGNIGRGFIGALLSQSGYEVTFIDVAEPMVKALQEKHTYPVRYVSTEGYEDVWIQNVTAVNGNDAEAAADAIAQCDVMAMAVGAAAAVYQYLKENAMEQTDENARSVLQEVSKLNSEEALSQMILARYREICAGATLDDLCATANQAKAASITNVV